MMELYVGILLPAVIFCVIYTTAVAIFNRSAFRGVLGYLVCTAIILFLVMLFRVIT